MNGIQILNCDLITLNSFKGACRNCGYGITFNYRCCFCLIANNDSRLNEHFRTMIGDLLTTSKFTHPKNIAEAERIVAGTHPVDYAQTIKRSASKNRMKGSDLDHTILHVHTELWRKLLGKHNYENGNTWETKNPYSSERGGIIGTVSSYARGLSSHYADKLQKRRNKRIDRSQSENVPEPTAPKEARHIEYEETSKKILANLRDSISKIKEGSPHWQARSRKLKLAHTVAKRMIEEPGMTPHEAMMEIPELANKPRGGLHQEITELIRRAAT